MKPTRRVGPIAALLWGAILLYLCIAWLPEAAFPETAFKTRIVSVLGLLNVSLYGIWGLVLIRFGVKSLRAFPKCNAASIRDCCKIAVALIDTPKGEGKAHACEMACSRET
jgi:hypothetical protein